MRFFARVRKLCRDIRDTIIRVVVPSVIAIGGTVSAIGGSLFILPRFVKLLTNEDDHPASLYSSFAVIFFALIINFATRFPAIYRHFSPEHIDAKPPENSLNEDEEFSCECSASLGLSILSKTYEYWTRTNSYASAGFMLLGSYLNAITVIEFLSKQAGTNPHAENAEYITQITAVLLAACATSKYAIFSLKKATANSKRIAKSIQNRTFPTDKAALLTFTVSLFGTMAVPFLSYYFTTNALGKIPLIKLPVKFKNALALVSSITGTTTHLNTQVPAVYTSFTKRKEPTIHLIKPWWETPSKMLVFGVAGAGDFAATNIGVFTSVDSTSHEVFDIDAKNPGLIVASCIAALSTATLNYFFSVYRGFEETLTHYHEDQLNAAYTVIQEKDIESGTVKPSVKLTTENTSINNENTPFYQATVKQLLFSNKISIRDSDDEEIALSLTP